MLNIFINILTTHKKKQPEYLGNWYEQNPNSENENVQNPFIDIDHYIFTSPLFSHFEKSSQEVMEVLSETLKIDVV